MKTAIQTLLALLTLTGFCGQGHARSAEEIFADAMHFTVRIDATFARPFMEDEVGAYYGAGFIVDKDRQWVMTNAHVVGHSPATLQALFADGTRVNARKVYVDPYIDLAIIELQEALPSMQEAPLACDQRPGIGHPVGAFGHPWELNFTGTQGVVSGRTTKFGPALLQTDTPINGGNSGGPLISMTSGKIVGISAARISRDDDQNTNFGVPIGQACQILALLQDGHDPSPPRLSTTFYKFISNNGPLIVARSFLSDNLLQLQDGDEIIAANGHSVSNESDLIQALRGNLESIQFKVRRNDKVINVSGRLNPVPKIVERRGLYFAGILFAEAGFRDRQVLETGHDVMIHSVASGSDADGAKLLSYDYIAKVNGRPVHGLDHLRQLLQDVDESAEVQMDFLRFVEDGDTGHLFYSLRRNFDWSTPEELGIWPSELPKSLQSRQ